MFTKIKAGITFLMCMMFGSLSAQENLTANEQACFLSMIPYRTHSQMGQSLLNFCVGDTAKFKYYDTYPFCWAFHPSKTNQHVLLNVGQNIEVVKLEKTEFWLRLKAKGEYYSSYDRPPGFRYDIALVGNLVGRSILDTFCFGSYPVETVYCQPRISIIAPVEVCVGQPFFIKTQSQRYPEQWAWDLPTATVSGRVDTSDITKITYETIGLKRLRVIASNPAGIDTAYHYVNVVAAPQRLDTISDNRVLSLRLGQSMQLQACATGNSYTWEPATDLSCQNCPTPTVSPQKVGKERYVCRVTNGGACVEECHTLLITTDDVRYFAPNAFTPNDDTINDFFEIKGIDIEIESLTIYDRWGNERYKEVSPTPKWSGGDNALPGTYVWMMACKDLYTGKSRVKSGTVILLR